MISALREVRRGAGDTRPLGVAGARELVPLLARELRKDGEAGAVVEDQLERLAVLDLDRRGRRGAAADGLEGRRADRRRHRGARRCRTSWPADLVRVPPGQGFPIEKIAEAVAAKLGDNGTSLAARLPVLRPAVCKAADRGSLASATR